MLASRLLRNRVLAVLPLAAALVTAPAFANKKDDDDDASGLKHKSWATPPAPRPAESPRPPGHSEPPVRMMPPQPERIQPAPSRSHDATPVESHVATPVQPSHVATPVGSARSDNTHAASPVGGSRSSWSYGATHDATPVGESSERFVSNEPDCESSPGVVYQESRYQAAPVQEEMMVAPAPFDASRTGTIDLGASMGINNPGGAFGGELEVRMARYFGVGIAAGAVPWGARITPQVRLYPFSYARGAAFFLEVGYSHNTGTQLSATSDSASQYLSVGPAETANAALGFRFQTGQHTFLALRAGYELPLNDPWVQAEQGDALDPTVSDTVQTFMRPGGFTAGLMLGISL